MPTTSSQLQPSQVAFFGECEASAGPRSASTSPLTVHALCWARTATAWSALAQSWTSMKAYRDEITPSFKHSKGHHIPLSWVLEAVPLLGAPFRDNPAEESTLAAWISRAQMSIAVAVLPEGPKLTKDNVGQHFRASFLECMSSYAEYLRSPGSRPCRIVLAAAHAPDRCTWLSAAFKAAHERQPVSFPPEPMDLQFCEPGEEPLPLSLTTLISAAVLRYVDDPAVGNPIFHALRPKLIRVPPAIASPRSARHRHMRLS